MMFLFKRKNQEEKSKNLSVNEIRDIFIAKKQEYAQEEKAEFDNAIQTTYELVIKKVLNGEFEVSQSYNFIKINFKVSGVNGFDRFSGSSGKTITDGLNELFNPHGLKMHNQNGVDKDIGTDYYVELEFIEPIFIILDNSF